MAPATIRPIGSGSTVCENCFQGEERGTGRLVARQKEGVGGDVAREALRLLRREAQPDEAAQRGGTWGRPGSGSQKERYDNSSGNRDYSPRLSRRLQPAYSLSHSPHFHVLDAKNIS